MHTRPYVGQPIHYQPLGTEIDEFCFNNKSAPLAGVVTGMMGQQTTGPHGGKYFVAIAFWTSDGTPKKKDYVVFDDHRLPGTCFFISEDVS